MFNRKRSDGRKVEAVDLHISSGVRLRGTWSVPDGGSPDRAVILTPGFTSKRENRTNVFVSERAVTAGIATLMLDLSGHGESGGSIADQTITRAAAELREAIDWVTTRLGIASNCVGLVGSSFSGCAALLVGAEIELAALSLKSPVTDYVGMRSKLLGADAMERWRREGSIVLPDGTASNYQFILDARSVDIYEAIRSIGAPVLVVQGSADEEIPRNHVERLRSSLPAGSVFAEISQADHPYSDQNHLREANEMLASFVVRHIS